MSKDFLEVSLQNCERQGQIFRELRGESGSLIVDYIPPVGDGEGYTSLELLLVSFASCVSTLMLAMLRSNFKKTVLSLQAKASGHVRSEHPKALTRIHLELAIQSPDVEESDVITVLKAAESKFCPVWAMIKGNVEIETSYSIGD